MDRMCVFDFIIVCATDTMIIMQYGFSADSASTVAPIMRAFRIARVVTETACGFSERTRFAAVKAEIAKQPGA